MTVWVAANQCENKTLVYEEPGMHKRRQQSLARRDEVVNDDEKYTIPNAKRAE